MAPSAHAQGVPDIPGSADPGRILEDQREQLPESDAVPPALTIPEDITSAAPVGAENLLFNLQSVTIQDITVFDENYFQEIYKDKIGKDIPASFLWELAATVTQTYRDEGYFLSKAYVPAQKIDTGNIRIAVIEGHIADIEIEGDNKDDRLVKTIANQITAQKPTKIKNLESRLLRLGDLYGINFDAVLSKKQDDQDGTVILKLKQQDDENAQITLSANNHGSRFVGPYRSSITYQDSIFDYHKTTVSGLATIPGRNELALASLNHRIQITPSVELDFLLSKTRSRPGFTLRQSDIESDSFSWGFGAQWIPIRQRDKNLKLFTRLESLNSNTNTFSTPLTRDRVRALRAGLSYDFTDRFLGFNNIALTISRGLSGLGASDENDLNLSRSDAIPDFTKAELSYNRQDYISNGFLLNFNLDAQLASHSLFSSEEFGYGGINIGRAYDFSEITGDHGISASMELQYTDLQSVLGYQINPYVFYDIGKVWNKGNAAVKHISGSSAGFGTRIYGDNNLSFDAALAFPITKTIDNPLYGNGSNPVFRFGLTYQFDVPILASDNLNIIEESHYHTGAEVKPEPTKLEKLFFESFTK